LECCQANGFMSEVEQRRQEDGDAKEAQTRYLALRYAVALLLCAVWLLQNNFITIARRGASVPEAKHPTHSGFRDQDADNGDFAGFQLLEPTWQALRKQEAPFSSAGGRAKPGVLETQLHPKLAKLTSLFAPDRWALGG
jgi:hypothetical protein